MAEITIEKTEYPNITKCKVGELLEVSGTVSAIDGDTLTIEVSGVEYGVDETESDSDEAPKQNPVSKIGVPGKKSYA